MQEGHGEAVSPVLWKRRVAYATAALAFGGAVAFALLEIAVRLLAPQAPPTLWLAPDAQYGHVMKPGFRQRYPFEGSDFVMDVWTNALGFRDEQPLPSEEGVKTIVFLGDSFTFGHGIDVKDRFDTRLKALCIEAGMRFRFINAGVNAWGTLQATRYLTDHFDLFEPDIVVLTFCENDPFDDAYFLEKGVSFDQFRFPGKTFLRAHSHLFRFAQQTYLRLRLWMNQRRQGVGAGQPAASAPPRDPQESIAIPETCWERTTGYLKEFLEAFLRFNPDGVLILQASAPTSADIRTHLSALADGCHVFYADLHDAAAALPCNDRHLPYDGHWNPKMHALSAKGLLRVLQSIPEHSDGASGGVTAREN